MNSVHKVRSLVHGEQCFLKLFHSWTPSAREIFYNPKYIGLQNRYVNETCTDNKLNYTLKQFSNMYISFIEDETENVF